MSDEGWVVAETCVNDSGLRESAGEMGKGAEY